jgi:periplasmic protein TonB
MTAKQTRRLLIVAFVLSLIVHLIVVLFVRWPFRPAANDVAVVHIEHIRPIRILHVTPPPRPPSPAPTIAPTTAPRRVRPRAVSANGTRPVVAAPPAATPAAPPPTPVASATPNCAKGDTPVTVAASPPPPDIPPNARDSTTGGTARVRVNVNANGAVTSATIAQSSGDSELDLIAMSMARAATYAPATHACKPVASQYAYAVKFVPW